MVFIRFGLGDVVFDSAGERGVHAVDDAENGVTFADRVDDNAHSDDVVDFVDVVVVALELLVEAVAVFDSAMDVYWGDAVCFEFVYEFFFGFFVGWVKAFYALFEEVLRPVVFFWLEVFEGVIFE